MTSIPLKQNKDQNTYSISIRLQFDENNKIIIMHPNENKWLDYN